MGKLGKTTLIIGINKPGRMQSIIEVLFSSNQSKEPTAWTITDNPPLIQMNRVLAGYVLDEVS